MLYQWGRKDPFTFATNSEVGGTGYQIGKYPVKIYTIDGVLIYQEYKGGSNKDKQPAGGVIFSSTIATSMMVTIKNPVTLYGDYVVISQNGQTKELWDYYWTSYSRGTDGYSTWYNSLINNLNRHNTYLDVYTSQKVKSIYDPCPYGFRILSNGSYNEFKSYSWVTGSYASGVMWKDYDKITWMPLSGSKNSQYNSVGHQLYLRTSTAYSNYISYIISKVYNSTIWNNIMSSRSDTQSVRCIEVSPPRQTDEIRLAMVVSIPVSKTVTLMECVINGGAKILMHLLQIAKCGELGYSMVNTLLRYIL